MRTLLFCLTLWLIMPTHSWSQSIQENRRIEEIKRSELNPPFVDVFKEPLAEEPPPVTEKAYFEQLLTRRYALNEDIIRAVAILKGVDHLYTDTPSRKDYLVANKIISKNKIDRLNEGQPVTKGMAACLFAHALEVKGGISLRLFPFSERYSLRELIYLGIMQRGNVKDFLTTDELVYVLTRSADHLTEKKQK